MADSELIFSILHVYFVDSIAWAGGNHRGYTNGIRASGHQRISIPYYTIRLGFILVGAWIRIALSYFRQTSFWQGRSLVILLFRYGVDVNAVAIDVVIIIITVIIIVVCIIIIIIIVLITGFITLISSIKMKWFFY